MFVSRKIARHWSPYSCFKNCMISKEKRENMNSIIVNKHEKNNCLTICSRQNYTHSQLQLTVPNIEKGRLFEPRARLFKPQEIIFKFTYESSAWQIHNIQINRIMRKLLNFLRTKLLNLYVMVCLGFCALHLANFTMYRKIQLAENICMADYLIMVYTYLQNKRMRRCGVPPPPTNNFRKT